MANVRFVRTTKQRQVSRAEYDQNALYFCLDSRELYRADQLLTDGVRLVATYNDLPAFEIAADGILYFVEETKNGYVLNTTRDGWLQVVYAPGAVDSETVTEITTTVTEEVYNTVYTKEEVYTKDEINNLITGGGVESITFAGVPMTEVDGAYSIDKDAALDALGIDVPVSADGETVVIATTETVTAMSDELKTYIDEQLQSVEAEHMDGGVIT